MFDNKELAQVLKLVEANIITIPEARILLEIPELFEEVEEKFKPKSSGFCVNHRFVSTKCQCGVEDKQCVNCGYGYGHGHADTTAYTVTA